MQDKRKWLPGWQRIELVGLCLDRGMSRREAASFRRVSVATVQYWIDRYRRATDEQRESGDWAAERPSTPHRQPGRVSDEVHDRVCEARRDRLGSAPDRVGARSGARDGQPLFAATRHVADAHARARPGAAL